VYYCPKCDQKIPKERLQDVDARLRERFGVDRLSCLRCPVCDFELIDLDKVRAGGEKHVGEIRRQSGLP
jgi:hypothetical protein